MKKISFIILIFLGVVLATPIEGLDPWEEEQGLPPEYYLPPPPPPCEPCPCGGYYYCAGGCGGELHYVTPGDPCCGSPCEDIVIVTCNSWQMCKTSPLGCFCEGECLETPQNPRYYDNPTYYDQPDKDKGNKNLFLPVRLDWDDVKGWSQPEGPQSYLININNVENATSAFPAAVNQSEFTPPSCALKSNATHSWQAKACCGTDGTNCGPENNWSLKTNLAPEPVSPYDPDWTGDRGAENAPLPATLDWCDVEEANSLLLRVYILLGGEKICHPNLFSISDGEEFCDSWVLRKKRRDPQQLERILYSDFPDQDMLFFTKGTAYLWEVATCLDNSGLNCKDYSQQWTFTAAGELPETSLVSPPNDPLGQKPVGLPLMLDWRKDAGINSWWYKINSKKEFAKTSQSRSFNYPELSLNTFYQWQVLSCWDYEGKQCQDSWSDVYHFKTTGQTPNLIFPTPGATDIPFPVNFDWQDVPGAKSYILSVQGDGLNVEKTLDESSFDLDFPEFPIRQETNYTWQVKTCAWKNGQTCGEYSSSQNFRTFRLAAPKSPSYPQDRGMLFTDEHFLSWEKVAGAKAYQYQIKYLSLAAEETDETCSASIGKEIFGQPQVTLNNSGFVELICLGQYQWQVRSCLDANCQEISNWSSSWAFTFLEGGTGPGGLVPCGRGTNNPNTPWNEREPCQIKHLFLSVKVIIDFLLFRVIPIILVLLTIATGVVFYTSLGKAIAMAQVISLWKAAGIGLGLIFFAWLIVNVFLGLVGYNVGVFGNWYQL